MLTPTALLWTRVGAAVLGLLIGTQSYGIWRSRRQTASGKAWPFVPGEVIESAVERHGISGDQYSAVVRYRYRVGSKDYEGDRIRIGGHRILTQAGAQARANKYSIGRRVRVYYDPQRPAHAVLEPGKSANMAPMIAFLLVFLAIEAVLVSILVNGGELPTTPGGLPWFAYFLPVLAIVVGGAGIGQYVQTRRLAHESERWPSAAGTITLSAVAVGTRETEKGRSYNVYSAEIGYSYRIGNSEYRGHAVGWGWDAYHGSPESAEAAIAKYPKGANVIVHYDPLDPERAVLDPQAPTGRAAPLVFGLVFGGVGALMLWSFVMIG
jgi:hypothetical protein